MIWKTPRKVILEKEDVVNKNELSIAKVQYGDDYQSV